MASGLLVTGTSPLFYAHFFKMKIGITAIFLGFLLLAGLLAFCIEITYSN